MNNILVSENGYFYKRINKNFIKYYNHNINSWQIVTIEMLLAMPNNDINMANIIFID